MNRVFLLKLSNFIIFKYNVDTDYTQVYNQPKLTQKVGGSGRIGCFTGNMNIALTVRAASSSPLNLERYPRIIMWNDFSSLEVLIRVCLYSRKMNGKNRNPDLNRSRLRVAKHDNSTAFISRVPVKWPAIVKGGF